VRSVAGLLSRPYSRAYSACSSRAPTHAVTPRKHTQALRLQIWELPSVHLLRKEKGVQQVHPGLNGSAIYGVWGVGEGSKAEAGIHGGGGGKPGAGPAEDLCHQR